MAGPVDGNPFVDQKFGAIFAPAEGDAADSFKVAGFYDGEGVYRVRFSPSKPGKWTYETHSSIEALADKSGEFEVAPALAGNHGPVRVHNTFHFSYADGEPYKQIGTTCYLDESTCRVGRANA